MQTFKFKDKSFDFPIGVYIYFGRLGLIANVLLPLVILFFIIHSFVNKDMFTAILGIFVIILFSFMIFVSNKPRLILYPDKIAFVEHGLIKPRYLSYDACKLYAYEVKHNSTGKVINILAFIYQDEKGDWQQFAKVNATYIRLNEHYFDTQTTLAFFEQLLGRVKR